jgi:hypothetical protein
VTPARSEVHILETFWGYHARCITCGWTGKNRSRNKTALRDGQAHGKACVAAQEAAARATGAADEDSNRDAMTKADR